MTVSAANWIPKPPPVGRLRRLLLRVTGPLLVLLVGSLFAVSFWESWAALTQAATQAAVPHPAPWPWAVDGFILVMALMVVQAKQVGASSWDWGLWAPRLGLVGATGLSTWIQYAYAPHDPWLHAWSPLAVLFSFECLIRLSYGAAVGAVAEQRHDVRDGGPPRPGETAEGVPLVAGTTQPTRLVRGTPPPSSVPSSVDGGHGPDTGAVNLPDTAATVTLPSVTVLSRPFTRAQEEALRRQKEDPAKYREIIVKYGLDEDAAMTLAARRGWPAANGHRKAVPA